MARVAAALVFVPALALAVLRGPAPDTESKAEDVRDVVEHVKQVEAGIRHDASSGDKDLKRRHLRKKFSDDLGNEVEHVLPDEVHALQHLFTKETSPMGRAGKQSTSRARPHAKFHRGPSYHGECGMKIKRSLLGLRGAKANAPHKPAKNHGAKLLQQASLEDPAPGGEEAEEEDDGPSRPVPGAGYNQTVADNGRSIPGLVAGEELFETVYKDGFWSVGCFMDSMLYDFDKYGLKKDQYHKDAERVNISIVHYSEMVLKDEQKPMTPRVCFEFCRTVNNMDFFGISGGQTCYCTPYYKPATGGEGELCVRRCPGDPNKLCGDLKKSSVYEMHTCGDKGDKLKGQAMAAGEALSDFYATALHAAPLIKSLTASGELLQAAAGAVGDAGASDQGQLAKQYAGELAGVFRAGGCLDSYNSLLTVYEEAEMISLLNMKKAENLQKADDAAAVMEQTMPVLKECTKKAEKAVQAAYPAFEDSMGAASEEKMLSKEESYARALNGYLPLGYVLENTEDPMPTTCSGEPVGKPMVATLAECAQACDDLVLPEEKCVGFQFFHLGGKDSGEEMRPLCFMLKETKELTKYKCGFVAAQSSSEKERLKAAAEAAKEGASLLQGRANRSADEPEGQGEGEAPAEDEKIDEHMCELPIQQLMLYTAQGCGSLFGPAHTVKDVCPAQCERSSGALLGAVCISKFSEISSGMANPKTTNKAKCFGDSMNKEVSDVEGSPPFVLPFDGQGVVLSGDADLGSETVLEPIIWTTGDER